MTPERFFPLEAGESALDSGCYRYHCNGERTDIVEPWCRHRNLQGALVTRALRTYNDKFLLAVRHRRESDKQQLVLRWHLLGSGQAVSAEYQLADGRLSWSRNDGSGGDEPIGAGVWLFPLMRVFTGDLLPVIEAGGGEGEVLLPSIKTPDRPETLFRPLLSTRRAVRLEDGSPCCYRYEGGEYEQGALCWLREDGLLERYQWQQGDQFFWEVDLEPDAPQSSEISTT